MQKLFLVLLFQVLCWNCSFTQEIDWDLVIDRYVEKYQPEEIPDWLFPIIFKDATGQGDTIYLGYDEDASIAIRTDTIFGEGSIPSDSTIFQAFWGGICPICDTFAIADINVLGGGGLNAAPSSIEFINALLPVVMHFDASLLETPILPFPEIIDKPNVQLEVSFVQPLITESRPNTDGSGFCNFQQVVISDSILIPKFYEGCVFSDSIVFLSDSEFQNYMLPLSLTLEPWMGTIFPTSTEEILVLSKLKLYPNPAIDKLNISIENQEKIEKLEIFNTSGEMVYSKPNRNLSSNVIVPVSFLLKGIYFLHVHTRGSIYRNKFIKTN